jgi:hypothetical protein
MSHYMSNDEFRIDGSTTFKLDTGNQGPGKIITSNSNGMLDWGTSLAEDGWAYTNNIIASGQGSTIINLSAFNHHMVVNNQGDVNYNTNKVRLVLPLSSPNFTKIRVTLMSEPWEVYIGSTTSYVFYNSYQLNSVEAQQPYQKGPVSTSTWTPSQWFTINPHNTIEFTRFYIGGQNIIPNYTTRDYWIVTSAYGTNLTN